MDCNKPVMQTHGNLVGRESIVFNPITSVAECCSEFDGDPQRLYTDVSRSVLRNSLLIGVSIGRR